MPPINTELSENPMGASPLVCYVFHYPLGGHCSHRKLDWHFHPPLLKKKTQNPPPKRKNFVGMGVSSIKDQKFAGAHKIGATISGPRIAGGKITDMRFFFSSKKPKPHPSKPHPCSMPQAKTEVALQFSECCAAEVAPQHWFFCSADVILTKSCAAASEKQLQEKWRFPADFKLPRLGTCV